MALLTYDGSAQDHEVIPQVLKIGRDGKPQKRKVKIQARTVYKQIDTYNLMGMLFPAGEALSVTEKGAVKKAASLGCFDVLITAGEPISHDKKWLEAALQGERVKMAESSSVKAPKPEVSVTTEQHYSDDGLGKMKRTELMRLASSRGINVNFKMSGDDLRRLLREQEAPALAEEASEGPDVQMIEDADIDAMHDVG